MPRSNPVARLRRASGICHSCRVASRGVFVLLALLVWLGTTSARALQSSGRVTTVSAANYAPLLAPDAIAAAFASPGIRLATRSEEARTVPLPTTLAGTTVRVNGELARLFFVSPEQVNYVIPAGTPAGLASVVITSGDGTVATGTVQIARVAPALFTANSNGQGVLAASLLRIKANGKQEWEALARYDDKTKAYLTQPFTFGAEGDQLFLVLFLTGIRQAGASNVRVSIGGVEYAPLYVGPQGEYAGLDQINVALPRSFSGRGRITLLVKAAGYGASNAGVFEIGAGAEAGSPVQIIALSPTTVRASEELLLTGAGFAANPRENLVQVIADDGVATKADVLSVTNALRVRLPFGAGTGQLKLSRGQSEASAAINVRTSISGFVENTQRQRLAGVNISLPGTGLSTMTDVNGSFVLPDLNPEEAVVFAVDARGLSGYDRLFHKAPARANRDNQYPDPITLQQINLSSSGLVASNAASDSPRQLAAWLSADDEPRAQTEVIQNGALFFDLPASAVVQCPDGTSNCTLRLTAVEKSRLPVSLPVGHYSSTVVQLTPFGAKFTPGGKLTFPNTDNLPAGRTATLFKFDQTAGSATRGSFIAIGTATVSADEQRVETAANAITEGSYYFVSIERPRAALNGRVLESDGRPVPRAIVRVRGQSTFTDGHGGFVLRDVPVLAASGDKVQVEVSYQRPDGRIARKDSSAVELTTGTLATVRPEIVLDPITTNFPPVLLAPSELILTAGETREFEFAASDPDSAQPLQLSPSGSALAFTTLSNFAANSYRLHLMPGANAAGNYRLELTAKDVANEEITQSIAVTVNPPNPNRPTAESQSLVTPEDAARTIQLVGNDPAGRALRYTIVSGPTRGRLLGAAPRLTYQPAPDYNGTDSFTFKVDNGSAESPGATVFIAVHPVNDAPVLIVPGTLNVNAGETLNVLVTATDVDGDQTLTMTATGLPPGATLTEAGGTSRLLSWSPALTQAGGYSVRLTVTDSGGKSDTKTVALVAGSTWAKTSGPAGGSVSSLERNDNFLFGIRTGSGIVRSADQGRSWIAVNEGLTRFDFQSFLARESTVLVGTLGGFLELARLYRSTNNGLTWTVVHSYPGNYLTFAVQGNTIYAGGSPTSIIRSNDDGKTWTWIHIEDPDNFPTSRFVQSLAVHNEYLYAATNGGIYRTADSGRNWKRVTAGVEGLSVNLLVLGSALFALQGSTFYEWKETAERWEPMTPRGLEGRRSLTRIRRFGNSLYVIADSRLYRSGDEGRTWTPVNLPFESEGVNGIFLEGTTMVIATRGGIYRSPDNGLTWEVSNAGLANRQIYTLAAHGPKVLTETDGGVYYSNDSGQSWALIATNLPGETRPLPRDSAFMRGNPVVVEGQFLLVNGDRKLYRWNEPERSWAAVNAAGLEGIAVLRLVRGGTALFAVTEKGIYRSTDQGRNWQAANTGIEEKSTPLLAANETSLFAVFNPISTAGANTRFYRSLDQGRTWLPVPKTGLVENLLISPVAVVGTSLVVGTDRGMFRWTESSQQWNAVEYLPTQGVQSISNLVVSEGIVYATTPGLFAGEEANLFLSTDGTQTWKRFGKGLEGLRVRSLAVSGNRLYAGTNNSVYLLTDSGQSWTPQNRGLDNLYVNALVAVGADSFVGTLGEGVFRSSDQGQSWTPVNRGLPANANIQSLVTNGTTLWAATFGDGVYRSTDQGASWTAVNTNLTNKFVHSLFVNGAMLYAGTDGGVFRSTDGGANWTALQTGLTTSRIWSFAAQAGVLYAGTDGGGVFRLSLEGTSWTPVNRGLTNLSVKTLGLAEGKLYAGTNGGGIFLSRDDGETWTPVNNQLPPTLNVFAFAVSGKKLYAGSIYGVFVTEDEGQSWQQVNAGLLSVYVTSLAVSGQTLLAGTLQGGVFVSQIPQP